MSENKKDDLINVAFESQVSDVEDRKPITVEKLMTSRPKKSDIIIPVDTNEGQGYLLASYPTKLDILLSAGNLVVRSIKDGIDVDLNNTTADEIRTHQRAFLQRILKFPAEKEGDLPTPITAEQIEQIDDDLIDDLYLYVKVMMRDSEVDSFPGSGETEENTDNTSG